MRDSRVKVPWAVSSRGQQCGHAMLPNPGNRITRPHRDCAAPGAPGTGKSMVAAWLAGSGPPPRDDGAGSVVFSDVAPLSGNGRDDPELAARWTYGDRPSQASGREYRRLYRPGVVVAADFPLVGQDR